MRIVHVEEFFIPQSGYQINLLAKFMAKDGHDVYIVSSEIDKLAYYLSNFFGKEGIASADVEYQEKNGVKVIRRPVYGYFTRKTFFQLGFLKYLKTLQYIQSLKPDVLFVHANDCIFGILSILYANQLSFPLVLDNHMLDMATWGDPLRHVFRFLYRHLITPIIKKKHLIIIRTQDDDYVERHLGIPLSQAPFISFGSDTMLFKPDAEARSRFRGEHQIAETDFVVVYTGKLIESKGGLLLAQTLQKKFENSKHKNVVFIVVGTVPPDDYGLKVKQLLDCSENRVLQFPTQNYTDLAQFYQASDLSIFPMQCSLSFYDAQACGLPVVSEDNNINADRLKYKNGFIFKPGDIEDFREKILHCVEMEDKEFDEMRLSSHDFVTTYYNYEDISRSYLKILSDAVEDSKRN